MGYTNTRIPLELTPTLCESNNWKVIFRATIPGTPPSTNTLYGTTFLHKRRFMTGKGKVYKNVVQDLAIELFKRPAITGTLRYSVKLFFDDTRRRDNANYEKCLIDALQGIVFEDDSQFKITMIEKHIDKKNPRTEVEISSYEPTKADVVKGLKEARETLGLVKEDFSPICLRCPLLFYWVTEGIVPEEGERTSCFHLMSRNIEHTCKKRPRTGKTDDIIKEGISRWL